MAPPFEALFEVKVHEVHENLADYTTTAPPYALATLFANRIPIPV